jgi:hypothetical protein
MTPMIDSPRTMRALNGRWATIRAVAHRRHALKSARTGGKQNFSAQPIEKAHFFAKGNGLDFASTILDFASISFEFASPSSWKFLPLAFETLPKATSSRGPKRRGDPEVVWPAAAGQTMALWNSCATARAFRSAKRRERASWRNRRHRKLRVFLTSPGRLRRAMLMPHVSR